MTDDGFAQFVLLYGIAIFAFNLILLFYLDVTYNKLILICNVVQTINLIIKH